MPQLSKGRGTAYQETMLRERPGDPSLYDTLNFAIDFCQQITGVDLSFDYVRPEFFHHHFTPFFCSVNCDLRGERCRIIVSQSCVLVPDKAHLQDRV
jgi:hypothetical protein